MRRLLQSASSSNNTAFGAYSLNNGYKCVAFGYNALNQSSVSSQFNVSFGSNSLEDCSSGVQNCSFGYLSSQKINTGSNNVSFGSNSLSSLDCSDNTAIGAFSNIGTLSNNSNNNTSIGYQSLYSNTTGNNNTAIGGKSLYSNTTGNNNTAIGAESLYENKTGNNNLAIGFQSGTNNINNNNNVFIGNYSQVDLSTNNWGNSVALGNNSTIYGENQITLGGPGGNVYVPGYMYVSNTFRTAAITERSDYRIKTNIKNLDESISTDFLSPVKYFNKKTFKTECGFIADDVEEVYPFLVGSIDIEEKYKFLNYTSIIGIITKDIIEIKKTNETIENMFNEFDTYLMQ